MILGKRISELRKQGHISQEMLAEEIGVSRQAVAKWEAGESLPDIVKVAALADFFEVSTDYLLGHELTNFDKLMQKIKELSDNSEKSYEGDIAPFAYRYILYMQSIGCTPEQIVDGMLEILDDGKEL